MSHEEKLFEIFKQLSFLQFKGLKELTHEQIDELYDTRPFQDNGKNDIPDEKNESHDPKVESDFNDVIKNY